MMLLCLLLLGSVESLFLNGFSDNNGCPSGSASFQDKCYYFSAGDDEDFNYVDAEIECHNLGGHLAADDSPAVHQFLIDEARDRGEDHYWLGATDFVREGHWRWLASGDDVGANGFNYWEAGQPDGTGPLTNCMAGYFPDNGDMVWRDYHCDHNTFNYICEKTKDAPQNVVIPPSGGCETGWAEFREDCIYISDTPMTFLESEVDCRDEDGYLASDDNPEKHQFLIQLTKLSKGASTGNNFWIGGTDFINVGEFRWSETGHPITGYDDWAPGEPHVSIDKNCIALQNSGAMQWVNQGCEVTDNYFICEKPNPSFVATRPTTTRPTTTPSLGNIIG